MGQSNFQWAVVGSVTLLQQEGTGSLRRRQPRLFKDWELLAYTLVPLVVLEVTLGAAAPVAADDVLAAMLTAVVALTLVHICKRSRASREPRQPLSPRPPEASSIGLGSQKAVLEMNLLKSYSSKTSGVSTLTFRDSW